MKLQFTNTISNSSTLQDVIRFASITLGKLQTIINGNVDLLENGNNQVITFNFTKINFDTGVTHTLGRVPRGYVNVGSNNAALGIKNGTTPNSDNVLYLQANALGTVQIMVF